MFDFLQRLDEQIFFFINHKLHFSYFHGLMPYWRSAYFWIPTYLFLANFLTINYKRRGWILLLVGAMTVSVSDMVSSHLIKKTVKRERPCQNVDIRPHVRLLVRCGSGYSFTSSHAANHFALAIFLMQTLFWKDKTNRLHESRLSKRRLWHYLLLLWAASIGLGQIYVGIHYPLDVFCGSLLGVAIGGVGAYLFRRFVPEYQIFLYE